MYLTLVDASSLPARTSREISRRHAHPVFCLVNEICVSMTFDQHQDDSSHVEATYLLHAGIATGETKVNNTLGTGGDEGGMNKT